MVVRERVGRPRTLSALGLTEVGVVRWADWAGLAAASAEPSDKNSEEVVQLAGLGLVACREKLAGSVAAMLATGRRTAVTNRC